MNDSAPANGLNEATDERHSLQTYVSDLLALEEHIGNPLQAQLDSQAMLDHPKALDLVRDLHARNAAHVRDLKVCLDRLGGHAGGPLKSAWASLLGGAASVIGGSRKTKVTKWLRDDYTALNLAAMGYTLLHATAVGVGDAGVSRLAQRGLADYARSVMEINQVIPGVVLQELRDEGVAVAPNAAADVREQSETIWRDAGKSLQVT